jgi:hypothetical protein
LGGVALFDEFTLKVLQTSLKWIAMKCEKLRAKRKKPLANGRDLTATNCLSGKSSIAECSKTSMFTRVFRHFAL